VTVSNDIPKASDQFQRRRLTLVTVGGGVAIAALLAVLYFLPVSVAGQVNDAASGQPLAGAAVTLSSGEQMLTDAAGAFSARASRFQPLSASVNHARFQPWQGEASFSLLPLAPAQLAANLQPTVLQGQVLNAVDGQPVAGATVSAGDQTATTDGDGRFDLERLPRTGAQVALAADGFIAYELRLADWDGADAQPVSLPLYPNGLHGLVSDAESGQPLAGADLTLNSQRSQSLDNGFFYFPSDVGLGEISVALPGFMPATVAVASDAALDGQETVYIALQPAALTGVISDYQTGQPLAGATVTAGGQTAASDDAGRYRLLRLHGDDLSLAAELEGFEPASLPIDKAANLLGGEPLDVALLAPHLAGRLVNNVTDNPIVGATVTAGDLTATSDDDGRFILWTTEVPLDITVEAPGYEPAQAEFTEDVELAVALEPKGLVVTVTDNAGQPVQGAVVTSQRSEAVSDAQGIALLPLIEAGDVYTVTAPNFAVVAQIFDGAAQAALALAPDTVIGQAVDAETGEDVLGLTVYVYDRDVCQGIECRGTDPLLYVEAADDGSFEVSGLPANPEIMLKAPGYGLYFPETLAGGECGAPYCLDAQMEPFEARGFYVPFHFLYDRALINSRLDLIEQSPDLNAVVIDMKSDYGEVAWDPQNPIAREIGIHPDNIMTAEEFLEEANRRGIYTIARFVTFKDDALAEGVPEWALRRRSNPDVLWKDGENLAWADPYLPEVRQYQIDLAKELSALGFDEIQFDYFRFSGLLDHNILTYSVESTAENRRETITNFAHELMRELKPYGIFTAIDVFGSIILNGNEPYIGQNLADMAQGLDYLSPMIYPQVWWPGTFPGCDEPVLCPYKVIYDSSNVVRSIVPLPTRIRPWLQGYPKNFRTEGPARGYDYEVPEMMIQRQAAERAGADGWLFWSGGGRFPDEIFGPMPSLADLEAQIRARQGGRAGPY
jgi:protocatechuate 3,4-dioxygenase beta subunit